MNLTVTGHHVDVTDSMRHYVQGKMKRLQRRSTRLISVQVTLTVEKLRRKAEATIEVAGSTLFAETTEPDMYAAIDLLADKLDRQLVRHKEKARSRRSDSPVMASDGLDAFDDTDLVAAEEDDVRSGALTSA